MCILLTIKYSQALGCLSSPLAFGVDFHVGHFQSYFLQFFFVFLPNFPNMLSDDTRMLFEQNIYIQ